jgi:thiaminase
VTMIHCRVETQEYIFVREFVRFLASVLLKASKDSGNEDINLIVGNLVSLDQELSWFRKEASNWKVDLLNSNLQKASKDYCKYCFPFLDRKYLFYHL